MNAAPDPRPAHAESDTYLALVCSRLSDDLSGVALQRLALRAPGPGEVRVRIRAAALNFPDLLMTQGKYQFEPPLPFVLGLEAAGEVVETGPGVTTTSVGERVYLQGKTGGFAEMAVLEETRVRRIPDGLDFAKAAALRAGSVTAYVSLVRRARLQRGETLLVHGASGGVGMAAVALGRHLGAHVIATGTSAEKLAIVKAQGAHEVIDLRGGFRERVKALTGGRGADVIFDPVGGDVFDESLRCIAWDGRLLVIGFASGRIPVVSANIPLIKGFSVVGVRAGEYARRFPERGRAVRDVVAQLSAEGRLHPHIDRVLPLSRWREALDAMAARDIVGKVVLVPGN